MEERIAENPLSSDGRGSAEDSNGCAFSEQGNSSQHSIGSDVFTGKPTASSSSVPTLVVDNIVTTLSKRKSPAPAPSEKASNPTEEDEPKKSMLPSSEDKETTKKKSDGGDSRCGPPCCFCPKAPAYGTIVILALALTLLFVAFSSSQSFMTTLHPDVGHIVLGVIYVVFAVANFVAPVVVHVLGLKLAIIMGSLPYLLLTLATGIPTENSLFARVLLILFAVLVGLGAGVLWASEGGILTGAANGKMALATGIFLSIFMTSSLLSFSLTGLVKNVLRIPVVYVFLILGWIGTCGVILFFCLRIGEIEKQKREHAKGDGEEEKGQCQMFGESLLSSVFVLFDLRFILFSPNGLLFGFTYAFIFGTLTVKVGEEWLPWIFTGMGVSEMACAWIYGPLTECFGKRKMAWMTYGFVLAVIIYSFFLDLHLVFSFVTVVLSGTAACAGLTITSAILGTYYRQNATPAFATYKFVTSAAKAFRFFAGNRISFFQTQILLIVLLVITMIGFFILDCCVSPVDAFVDGETEDCGDANLLRCLWSTCCKKRCSRTSEEEGEEEGKEERHPRDEELEQKIIVKFDPPEKSDDDHAATYCECDMKMEEGQIYIEIVYEITIFDPDNHDDGEENLDIDGVSGSGEIVVEIVEEQIWTEDELGEEAASTMVTTVVEDE